MAEDVADGGAILPGVSLGDAELVVVEIIVVVPDGVEGQGGGKALPGRLQIALQVIRAVHAEVVVAVLRGDVADGQHGRRLAAEDRLRLAHVAQAPAVKAAAEGDADLAGWIGKRGRDDRRAFGEGNFVAIDQDAIGVARLRRQPGYRHDGGEVRLGGAVDRAEDRLAAVDRQPDFHLGGAQGAEPDRGSFGGDATQERTAQMAQAAFGGEAHRFGVIGQIHIGSAGIGREHPVGGFVKLQQRLGPFGPLGHQGQAGLQIPPAQFFVDVGILGLGRRRFGLLGRRGLGRGESRSQQRSRQHRRDPCAARRVRAAGARVRRFCRSNPQHGFLLARIKSCQWRSGDHRRKAMLQSRGEAAVARALSGEKHIARWIRSFAGNPGLFCLPPGTAKRKICAPKGISAPSMRKREFVSHD
ncbi:MAG: hypothetical protein BWZ10_02263 [candidate division BRC1 bacterium ADurb.BinA364]|nr:MAG: hypothetical protein BWZ10_02263 [candidate division BRC1 bacterium ADurb.BinA364]